MGVNFLDSCGVKIPISGVNLGIPIKPAVRTPEEMKAVAYDPASLDSIKEPLYYMYRDVWGVVGECGNLCKKHGLRYDITIIQNGFMGEEYYKTLGHIHPLIKEKNETYPELYEVLSGKAAFLIQKNDLTDFQVIFAEEGTHALIPPDYGHATVNIGNTPLIMGNLVADGFLSNYEPILKKHGMAYYVLKSGLKENPNYEEHPKPFKRRATSGPSLSLLFKKDPSHYERLLR
ncbi:MAG: glucose-6-phosphate isomerase [Candidatus Diapherotrites archaeon]|nr:glucose-6-phosphate isomerase [Candidatus Diapherotrites archaeon]